MLVRGDLPLGLHPEREHQLLITFGGEVHPPACLGHPQLHAVMLEQRCHQRVLAAVEGPLVFADHNRVEGAIRVGKRGQQRGGLRAARPRQHPAVPTSKNSATIHPNPATSTAA